MLNSSPNQLSTLEEKKKRRKKEPSEKKILKQKRLEWAVFNLLKPPKKFVCFIRDVCSNGHTYFTPQK